MFHLPAVKALEVKPNPETLRSHYSEVRDIDYARNYSPSEQVRLVSACGRAGPIRARAVANQWLLIGVPPDLEWCPGCQVLWDQAEEAGQLLTAYTFNGNQEWKASTVASMCPPRHRSGRSYHRRGDPKDLRVTVFVRHAPSPRLNTPRGRASETP